MLRKAFGVEVLPTFLVPGENGPGKLFLRISHVPLWVAILSLEVNQEDPTPQSVS
jgi:hypothetical protein